MALARRLLLACLILCLPVSVQAKIRLGILPVPDTLPLQVAAREKLFDRHGLEVELVPFASALERDTAMQTGNLDGYFGDMVATLLLIKAGVPLSAVLVSYAATPGQPMFGLVTSPGKAKLTAKDLPGKSVGLSESTIIEFLLERMLPTLSLAPDAMTRVDVKKLPVRLQMLLADQLDTALMPQPFLALAQRRGGTVLATDENLALPLTVVCLTRTLAADPNILEPFLEAYTEALEHLRLEPKRYAALQIETCRIPPEIAADFPVMRYPDPRPPAADEVKTVVDWMLSRKLLTEAIAYDAVVAGGAPGDAAGGK